MTIGQPATTNGDQQDGYDHINLKVMAEDSTIVLFKIKKRTCLGKLMNAYCDRVGVTMAQVIFKREGDTLIETDTPMSREMNDDDVIEVYKLRT